MNEKGLSQGMSSGHESLYFRVCQRSVVDDGEIESPRASIIDALCKIAQNSRTVNTHQAYGEFALKCVFD
jgi:hypothetical protein